MLPLDRNRPSAGGFGVSSDAADADSYPAAPAAPPCPERKIADGDRLYSVVHGGDGVYALRGQSRHHAPPGTFCASVPAGCGQPDIPFGLDSCDVSPESVGSGGYRAAAFRLRHTGTDVSVGQDRRVADRRRQTSASACGKNAGTPVGETIRQAGDPRDGRLDCRQSCDTAADGDSLRQRFADLSRHKSALHLHCFRLSYCGNIGFADHLCSFCRMVDFAALQTGGGCALRVPGGRFGGIGRVAAVLCQH